MADLFLTSLLQGLVISIIAYGIMIPFRFLDFPDLTAEGGYPVGGAVCAVLISQGISPIFSIILAMIASGLVSLTTAQVNLKLKVNSLLAGIIVSTMCYSINLKIMSKPNIALFNYQNIFYNDISLNIIMLLFINLIFVLIFYLYMNTDFGLKFRSIGLNYLFARNQKINIEKYTRLGLFISGSLFGLAGSLIVQIQSYMDLNMGVGILIHGLASLMIGEIVLTNNSLIKQISSPLIGALIYQQIQGLVLFLGLNPSDLKLFTGITILLVIAFKNKS